MSINASSSHVALSGTVWTTPSRCADPCHRKLSAIKSKSHTNTFMFIWLLVLHRCVLLQFPLHDHVVQKPNKLHDGGHENHIQHVVEKEMICQVEVVKSGPQPSGRGSVVQLFFDEIVLHFG